jgi:hypothetical protein
MIFSLTLTTDQVPEQLFQRPTDKASAHSNGFIHINLTLDSSRDSTVIMPAQARENLAQGTALSLLDRLKSLSEASTSIYTSSSTPTPNRSC